MGCCKNSDERKIWEQLAVAARFWIGHFRLLMICHLLESTVYLIDCACCIVSFCHL